MKELLIVLLAVILGTVSGNLSSFYIDKNVAMKGNSVKLTCVLDPIPTSVILNFEKVVEGAEENTKLSTNQVVDATLPDDIKSRYAVTANAEGTGYKFELEITDVTLADNGKFRCVWQESQDNKIFKEVSLTVPVDPQISMTFINGSTTENVDDLSNGIRFSDGEEATFECMVTGSNPAPMVKILLEDVDISDRQEVVISEAMPAKKIGVIEGFDEVTYTVTAKVNMLKMTPEFSWKNIICQAKTDQMAEPMEKKVLITSAMMKPIITCEGTTFIVQLFQPFTTHCNVTGKVTKSKITYYRPSDLAQNDTLVLLPETRRGSEYYPFLYQFESMDEDNHKMTLKIARVYFQDLRPYNFLAINEMGVTNATISLEKDPSQIISGATPLQISFMSIITVFIVLLQ